MDEYNIRKLQQITQSLELENRENVVLFHGLFPSMYKLDGSTEMPYVARINGGTYRYVHEFEKWMKYD